MLRRGAAVASALGGAYLYQRRSRLPETFVLRLDLATKDDAPLREAIVAVDAAAKDARVVGLVTTLGGARLSLAQSQELGAAIGRFREVKATTAPTYAFSSEYDSPAKYLLACSCGTVVSQPGGMLRLPSISLELPYLGALCSRLGLQRQRVHATDGGIGAASVWADRAPSKAQARNAEQLVQSSYEQLVRGVSAGAPSMRPAAGHARHPAPAALRARSVTASCAPPQAAAFASRRCAVSVVAHGSSVDARRAS
jgi:hypothetical protein